MKRLVRKADEVGDAKKLLMRVDGASHELKDSYYVLFDNLNALAEAYPSLYKEIQMVVKLPSNDDAKNIMQFYKDLHEILNHLADPKYLDSYINPQADPNEEKEDSALDSPDPADVDPDFNNEVDQKFEQNTDNIGNKGETENE